MAAVVLFDCVNLRSSKLGRVSRLHTSRIIQGTAISPCWIREISPAWSNVVNLHGFFVRVLKTRRSSRDSSRISQFEPLHESTFFSSDVQSSVESSGIFSQKF